MDRLITGVLLALCSVLWSYRAVRALQMNGYRFSLDAIAAQRVRIIAEYCYLAVFTALAGVSAGLTGKLAATIAVSVISAVYAAGDAVRLRTHLKFTHRAVRLTLAVGITLAGIQAIAAAAAAAALPLTLAGLIILMLARPIAIGVNYIISPLEALNNKRYLRLAKTRLNALRAIKIGITGSYGKTSCKNILADMLAVKYKVIKTEKNYNTPLGIARTVQRLEGDEEVFIAEMGARRQGDIKQLADIVSPKYAIITGVSPQHLSTFKSEKRIYLTKKELLDSLPSDGFAVFNGDNKYSLEMANSCPLRCAAVFTHNTDGGVYAQDIQLNNNGSTFTVKGLGEDISLSTRLLGRHNIINILMCLVLAKELGVDTDKLVGVVKELKPTPHRLELLDTKGGVTIIDDSYNGNLEGVRFALEVLTLYKDKRKVVFTQGIVELGKKQAEINTLVGAMVAEVADAVILTGENTSYIRQGLINGGFYLENIFVYKTFKAASDDLKNIIHNNDILLIQNDIP